MRRASRPRHVARAFSSGPRPLSEIPGPKCWPLVGTLPDFLRRSGRSAGGETDSIAAHRSYYREFGDIYRLSMPPFGEHVVVCDPRQYLQVFQMEGKHPPGASQYAWPFMHYHEKSGNETIKKIMLDGEPWHEYRHQLAKDIFGPPAAREYLPFVSEAVRLASASATEYEDRFDEFLSRLAFDMFCALALGRQAQTTNERVAEARDLEFVQDSMRGFSLAGQLLTEPQWKFLPWGKMPGFMAHMQGAQRRGEELVAELWDTLDAEQSEGSEGDASSSYMAKLIRRGQLSRRDISETLMALLMAGVDTTSYVSAWLFLNLAQHPEKQERLRQELSSVLKGADLTEEVLGQLPYLKACIRESHRHTPPGPLGGIRKLSKTAVFSGYEIPQGTTVIMNQVAFQQDPKYLDGPGDFYPERWLPEEVSQRTSGDGTPSVLDHRLLSGPFGFGARMCLGARVAALEIQAATCRLVQDYRLELVPGQTWKLKQGLFVKADPFPRFRLTRL